MVERRVGASSRCGSCSVVVLSALTLLACGSTPSDAFSDGGTGGTPDAGTGGGLDGSSPGDAAGTTGTDDGSTATFGSNDAASPDASACTHLNIGILGLPGSNGSSNFQAWLVSAGTSVTSIQTTANDPLTSAELAPFDVVILNWLQRDYTASEAALFAAWVSNGGGVAAMSGFDNNTTDDWHANGLLAPLGVAYVDPFFESGPVTDFAVHPITTGLTSVTFDGGYAIADLGGTASTRTPLAFLPDASADAGDVPVSYAVTMGAGHAFVWGDEWIQFDSEWSTIPQIKQLWVQVFGWLAPPSKCAITPPK